MDTKLEKLPQSRIRTVTTVTKEEHADAEKKALAALAEHTDIKGFRIGKAPADMVRSRVGQDRLMEETVRQLLPAILKEALEISKAKPMLRPAASVVSTEPLTIALTFVERPPVTVKKAESLTVEKKQIPEASEKDIEAFIRKVLIQDKTETPVDRPAAKGDFVRLALASKKKDKPVDELTIGNYSVVIGSEDLLPELEPHITGMKKDEKKTSDILFPKDHDIPGIRGEKISVEMTVQGVAEVKLPELTQAYIKQRLGTDSTPEAFRADVKRMLTDRARSQELKRREEELYSLVRAATTVDLAPEVIDAEVQDMASDLRMRLEKQNLTMDDWLKSSNKDPKAVVDEMKQIAENRIRLRFGMQELAAKLKIDADPAAIETALASAKEAAKTNGRAMPEEEMTPGGSIYEHIRFDLTMQKLVSSMIEDAPMKERVSM